MNIWSRLHEIEEEAKNYAVRDPRVRRNVLAAGPCPGLWRVYYSAVTEIGVQDETLRSETFLKIQIPKSITQRELGILFEQWVSSANHQYNRFLENGDINALANVPGTLGEYYHKRATDHLTKAGIAQLTKSRLSILPEIVLLKNIHSLKPDGIFCEGTTAVIFESKLSVPTYAEFRYEMAMYALAYEKESSKLVDYAIILHTDYPKGEALSTKHLQIQDSTIDDIVVNLERFINLIRISVMNREEAASANMRPGEKTPTYNTWKDFVIRPRGLPDGNNRAPCSRCQYRTICYPEGGEE